jgi:hypothetical protein
MIASIDVTFLVGLVTQAACEAIDRTGGNHA